MRKTAVVFGITALVFTAGAGAQTEPPPRPFEGYHFVARDRYRAAQARVHEAGFQRGLADGGGILQVVMARRNEGESFEESLARAMPHFWAGVLAAGGAEVTPCADGRGTCLVSSGTRLSARRWVTELPNAELRRGREPLHWPYGYPARVHDDDWRDANDELSGYMRGETPLPFREPVSRWFGRETDGTQLAAALEDGWCEAIPRDGLRSLNAFLYPCETSAEGSSPSSSGLAPESASE